MRSQKSFINLKMNCNFRAKTINVELLFIINFNFIIMKRGLLFSTATLMLAVSVMAQTDITPSRYKFADQPVGQWTIDEALPGANPSNAYAPAVDNFHDGYVIINNGQFGAGLEAPNAKAIVQGLSIVDLGGEVNKVLCMKGKDSKFPYGTASQIADGLKIGWWNMSFFTSSANVEKEHPVRFSIVFKLIENQPDLENGFITFDAYTYAGNNLYNPTNLRTIYKSGDFIQRYEDDGSPVEDDNGDYIYDDDLWQKFEFDYQAGDEAGIPLRLMIAFSNQNPKFNNTTLLIKSITMTKDPSGEPEIGTVKMKWNPISVGVQDLHKDNFDKIQYICEDNVVKFSNINDGERVDVYSINGQSITSFIANGTSNSISLNKGFYIVKAGSNVSKVIVK